MDNLVQSEKVSRSSTNNKRKRLLLFIGTLFVACIFVILFLIVFVNRGTISSRSSAKLNLQYPSQAQMGGTFEVVITLQNIEEKALTFEDITIDSSSEFNLLTGVEFMNTNPPFSTYRELINNTHYYFFDNLIIAPKQSQTVTVQFRAVQEGTFNGLIFVDVVKDSKRFHTLPEILSITVVP